MNLPHRRRPRGYGRLTLTGDPDPYAAPAAPIPGFDDDGQAITDAIRALPGDGTIQFAGASITGLPDGITTLGFTTGPIPLRGYQPAPAAFPALPAQPEPPVLAAVPVTEPAVIGDQLRIPVTWCEMPRCINWCTDSDAAGPADMRQRAIAHGWRTDGLGRLACRDCQQHDPGFYASHPVAWNHKHVTQTWWGPCTPQECLCGPGGHIGETLTDTGAFRLAVRAEYGRRISREDLALARDLADAAARHAAGDVTP